MPALQINGRDMNPDELARLGIVAGNTDEPGLDPFFLEGIPADEPVDELEAMRFRRWLEQNKR